MTKIVINGCFGGYGLSFEALIELGEVIDELEVELGYSHRYEDERSNPRLVDVVEKLGEKANGKCAKLCVAEIPDGVEWAIEEYDGLEHVVEKHRKWY